jgi:heme exporter protein D
VRPGSKRDLETRAQRKLAQSNGCRIIDLQEFLHMDGYGPYVWSCFGLTFAVLIYIGFGARAQLREQIMRARRRASVEAER